MPSVPPRTVRVLGLVYSVQGSPTIQMVGQAGPICGLASVFRSFCFPKGNQDYKGDKAELKASIFSPGHTPLCLCPPAWASITQPALVTLPGPGGGPAPVLTTWGWSCPCTDLQSSSEGVQSKPLNMCPPDTGIIVS